MVDLGEEGKGTCGIKRTTKSAGQHTCGFSSSSSFFLSVAMAMGMAMASSSPHETLLLP